MKKKLIGSLLLGVCAALVGTVPAMADSRKVVTLGTDLSQEQKDTMMRYFGVTYDGVDVIYITNQDERDHLGSYVPLEQIGTRTYSCALVAPTSSGGIQVKTANLEWVTCNMIASTLSTSGVANCQVVAACPFKVSGTGALTGIIMAYEDASNETLDPVKVDLANQELVTTGNLSDSIGQSKATAIMNETKSQVIENNVTDIDEITHIVNNVSNNYEVDINSDQSEEIAQLMQQIAEQEYDIIQLKATLDRVQANVAGDAGASEEEQKAAQEKAEASERAALEAAKAAAEEQAKQMQELQNGSQMQDAGVLIIDSVDMTDDSDVDDNILENTDPSILEELGGQVEEVDTTQSVQEQSEAQTEQPQEWDNWDVSDGTVDEIQPQEGAVDETQPQDVIVDETQPQEGVVDETQPQEGVVDETQPQEGAVDEAQPQDGAESQMQALTEEVLTGEDREKFDKIRDGFDRIFVDGMVSSEDGSVQVYLTAEAEKQVPEKIKQYVLKVMTQGADVVAEMEKADPAISQTIVEDTSEEEPDAQYEDEQLVQIDKYVRRLILTDSEKTLEDSYLEDFDYQVLYEQIMLILEEAYGVEAPEVEDVPEIDGSAQIGDDVVSDELDDTLDDALENTPDDVSDIAGDGEAADEFADFDEETGEF